MPRQLLGFTQRRQGRKGDQAPFAGRQIAASPDITKQYRFGQFGQFWRNGGQGVAINSAIFHSDSRYWVLRWQSLSHAGKEVEYRNVQDVSS